LIGEKNQRVEEGLNESAVKELMKQSELLVHMFFGMETAAHHGAAFDMEKTFGEGCKAVHFENIRVNILFDSEMGRSRSKVLADSEDLAACKTEVVYGFEDFGFGFAQADHDSRLRTDAGSSYLFDYCQAAVVLGGTADERGKAADGFEVVGDDIGL